VHYKFFHDDDDDDDDDYDDLNGAKDDGGGGDNWSYKTCKAPVKMSPPTSQHPVFFTGSMSFPSHDQQYQCTEENITFHELAQTKPTRKYSIHTLPCP